LIRHANLGVVPTTTNWLTFTNLTTATPVMTVIDPGGLYQHQPVLPGDVESLSARMRRRQPFGNFLAGIIEFVHLVSDDRSSAVDGQAVDV